MDTIILRGVAEDGVISVEMGPRKNQMTIEDFERRMMLIIDKRADGQGPVQFDATLGLRKSIAFSLPFQLYSGWEWVDWNKSQFNLKAMK